MDGYPVGVNDALFRYVPDAVAAVDWKLRFNAPVAGSVHEPLQVIVPVVPAGLAVVMPVVVPVW